MKKPFRPPPFSRRRESEGSEQMYKFILKRLIMMIPVLLGVVFIIFTMMYLTPGSPEDMILGDNATEEDKQELREELGLDDPFLVRFGSYIFNIVTKGDFGTSYSNGRSVTGEILDRFPTTALLALLSMVVALCIGVPLGILAATKQYSIFDHLATTVSLFGISVPNFWLGMMLIIVFAVHLGILPPSGFYGAEYWILPAITVGSGAAANIMRTTRSTMLEVIRQDYIRCIRANGQSEGKTIWGHALRNALIPIVTVVGIQCGVLLGGTVLVETVFAIPGLGKLMVDSIKAKDYPMVQGGVLFIALVFCLINLLVDVLYAYIDPRIKSQYQAGKRPKKG